MALTFLRNRVRTTAKRTVGLGKLLTEKPFLIPGNHDHLTGWGISKGLVRFRPASSPRETYFGSSTGQEWWRYERIKTPSFDVELCGLDTCGAATMQWGARGAIEPQAEAELSQRLAATAKQRSVRVLVMHHSPSFKGGANSHCLDTASESLYDQFCLANGIHFTLTGHAHVPEIMPPRPYGHGWEARCGTTTQYGAARSNHGQIFMAHVLEQGSPLAQWTTRVYQRKATAGHFAEAKSLRQTIQF
jgi:hypothetical protein